MPSEGASRAFRAGLVLLYGLAGVAVLLAPWLPTGMLMEHVLYEDFFYYLKIAKNILELGEPTFDGTAPTNGFAPVWIGVCVVVQFVAQGDVAIHLLLTLGAVLHLAQSYLVYLILRSAGRPRIAHIGAIFYLLSYRIFACNLCGLETPLVLFLFLAVIRLLVRYHGPLGMAQSLLLGVLLGVAVLTRFDQILLVGLVLALVVASPRFGEGLLRYRIPAAATIAGTVLLLLMPWFAWSRQHSGTLLPRNDEALKLCRFEQFDLNRPLPHNVRVLRLKVKETAWWLSDAANLLGLWPVARPAGGRVMGALAGLVLVGLGWGLFATRASPNHGLRCALAGYAFASFLFYFVFACAEVRYLIPCCSLIVIVSAMVANELLSLHDARWVRGTLTAGYASVLAIALAAGVSAWHGHQGATRTHALHASLHNAAKWVREHTEADDVIGSWNAGILGHYSDRTVVNLDGVVNNEAIDAMRHCRLSEYIRRRGITYLVDMPWEMERYMRRFAGELAWREGYELAHQVDACTVALRRKSSKTALVGRIP